MKRTTTDSVSSVYIARGNTADRRRVLLAGALADVARLEAAQAAGWDVSADLAQALRYVAAFSD